MVTALMSRPKQRHGKTSKPCQIMNGMLGYASVIVHRERNVPVIVDQNMERKMDEMAPNPEVMSELNYLIYCSAWCATACPEIDIYWSYNEYNYAGDNGIVFC